MDWDGVGTFALFISSGAVGLGIIALKAYTAKLAARLEGERLRRLDAPVDEGLQDQVHELEKQVRQLSERVDFSERLLTERSLTPDGTQSPADAAT